MTINMDHFNTLRIFLTSQDLVSRSVRDVALSLLATREHAMAIAETTSQACDIVPDTMFGNACPDLMDHTMTIEAHAIEARHVASALPEDSLPDLSGEFSAERFAKICETMRRVLFLYGPGAPLSLIRKYFFEVRDYLAEFNGLDNQQHAAHSRRLAEIFEEMAAED